MSVSLFEQIQQHVGQSPEEAAFFWSGGPVEVAERTWFCSAFSSVIAFETDDGIVLVDSGLKPLSPILARMLRSRSDAPIHTVVFTQGHLDHTTGVEAFLRPGQDTPRIIAHRAMPKRFERYEQTEHHNRAINARQYGAASVSAVVEAMSEFRPPTMGPTLLYDDRFTFQVGGVRFDLNHCRGETDDHTWVHCPDRSVLCPGDLFIWAVPNAGNPQKVQRYPWDWAKGLRAMATLQPASFCPGHGGPIVDDPATIQDMLLSTAEYLDTIVERTMAALNDGSPPHVDIIHRVQLPESDKPWLKGIYDDAEFIIRNIIRYYGGWWTGRPSELKPAPRDQIAHEIVTLAGGSQALIHRAQALAMEGDLRTACHLADYALEANPNDDETRATVAALYEQRSSSEVGLMASNIFSAAADFARQGRPFA